MSARELVGYAFEMRTAAHLAHLNTALYSAHMALEAFYNGIGELADEFAEVWMGLNDAVIGIPPTQRRPDANTPVKALESFLKWLDDNCDDCTGEDPSLENIHAEIRALTARTLYKLNQLG